MIGLIINKRFSRFTVVCFIISVLFLTSALISCFLSLAYAETPVYPGLNPKPLINIRDLVNIQGPANTKPVTRVPSTPLKLKANAVDAVSTDFLINNTSYNKANIFATVTKSEPYTHSYLICNRWSNFTLDNLALVDIPNLVPASEKAPQFWSYSMSKEGIIEKAYTFIVLVDEASKTFTVDSALWASNIPLPKSTGNSYMFNMQIWAGSQPDADLLLHNFLARLNNYKSWQVKYANSDAVQPPFFIKNADKIHMRVLSLLPQAQKVRIACSIRYASDKSKVVTRTFGYVLNPGLNLIDLPLTNAIDANIFVNTKGFTDRTYVGNGYWLKFGKSIDKTEVEASDLTLPAEGDFLLGSAGIKGQVPADSTGGLARTLNPSSIPVDVSKYNALSFWVRGDGKSYSVQLETKAVRDTASSDFHQFVITTTPEWKQYVIPLASFKQAGTDPSKIVPYTGTDVISVAWETIGAPLDSVELEVCNAAFINQ